MNYNSKLAELISERLQFLDLSYEEAGRSAGKYAQWLSILMDHSNDKLPPGTRKEFDALFKILSPKGGLTRKILKIDGKNPKSIKGIKVPSPKEVDEMAYLELVLALLDREDMVNLYTPYCDTEYIENHYASLEDGSHVYVITPTLSQETSMGIAKFTASAMCWQGIHLTFFVPIKIQTWKQAARNIESAYEAISTKLKSPIKQLLSIYGISGLITSPTIITRPCMSDMTVFINVKGWGADEGQYVKMDSPSLNRDIWHYEQLKGLGENLVNPKEENEYAEGLDEVSGLHIKRFYPQEL